MEKVPYLFISTSVTRCPKVIREANFELNDDHEKSKSSINEMKTTKGETTISKDADHKLINQ